MKRSDKRKLNITRPSRVFHANYV